MVRRILSLIVLIWLLGFMWFAIFLPGPEGSARTDAVVVFTGGENRIDRGLETLRKGWARRLLVAGVDRQVTPAEFAAEYDISPATMHCCVTLDQESYDTRSNARITADWLVRNKFRSVRLITTDWHMRRAALELDMAKPAGLFVIRDPVRSEPSFGILFLEYHKLLARRLSQLWDH